MRSQSVSQSPALSRTLSVYLDLLRLLAALAVFGGHLFTNARWSGFHNKALAIQNDAVICFFILSGMVIGFASEQKEHDLSTFLRARLARLWSVAIPALLLTPLLDWVGQSVDPSAYFVGLPDWGQGLKQFLISVFFLNETGHWSVIPGSDLPYWSLSYEFFYYLLFGLAFYGKGWLRILAMLGVVALAGPRILLLAPIWLMGLAVWQARKNIPTWAGWPLVVGPVVAYAFLAGSGLGPRFGQWVDDTLLKDHWLVWSRLAAWKYLLGILAAAHILGFAALSERLSFGRAAAAIRAAAGGTFALYLFHYPLLSFFAAVAPGPRQGLWRCVEIGGLTLICVAGIAWLTERQKDRWRSLLDRLWEARLGIRPNRLRPPASP
jgi:peptidoglycan/LPS O-acetylase OafA/YrhL